MQADAAAGKACILVAYALCQYSEAVYSTSAAAWDAADGCAATLVDGHVERVSMGNSSLESRANSGTCSSGRKAGLACSGLGLRV
jgi:hypothetical protein